MGSKRLDNQSEKNYFQTALRNSRCIHSSVCEAVARFLHFSLTKSMISLTIICYKPVYWLFNSQNSSILLSCNSFLFVFKRGRSILLRRIIYCSLYHLQFVRRGVETHNNSIHSTKRLCFKKPLRASNKEQKWRT